MINFIKKLAKYYIILYLLSSCQPSKCVIYDLNKYKSSNIPYIPIYIQNNPEWINADHILKDIVAPANWGSKRHQYCGLEYKLYIRTTASNHKKISKALPTLWKPN